MTPEEMTKRLAAWVAHCEECSGLGLPPCGDGWRRVVCVESEGPRRTWTLWQGTRQVGHVRMRGVGASSGRPYGGARAVWTVEASDRTRLLLGLDDAAESGQTDPGQSR